MNERNLEEVEESREQNRKQVQVASAREQDRARNLNKEASTETVGKEDDPTLLVLKPVEMQQNKFAVRWVRKVTNRRKANQLKFGHPGDQDAQGSLSKTRTFTGWVQKLRQKQTSREGAEVRAADKVAR